MAIELLQAPPALAPAGNPVVFRVRAGASGLIAAVLMVEVAGGFKSLPEMCLYPDAEGVTEIDFSRILLDRMEPGLPDASSASIQVITGNVLRYKIVFTGDGTLETTVYTAIGAKFPSGIGAVEYLQLGKGYLSMAADRQETSPDGVHYLCFFCLTGGKTYRVRATGTSLCGGKREYVLGAFGAVQQYVTYVIPVGLRHVSFLNDNRDLVRYTVWVEDSGGNVAGRPVTYNVVRSGRRPETLVFRNTMGGWDALEITGQKDTLKVEREDYNLSGNIRGGMADFTNTIECTSGYVSKAVAEMYKELLVSGCVCIAGADFVPVVVEKGTFTIVDETSELESVSFKYKPAKAGGLIRHYGTPAVKKLEAALTDQREHVVMASDKEITVTKTIEI